MSLFDFESGKTPQPADGPRPPAFADDPDDVRVKIQAIEWLDNQVRARISDETTGALTCLYACQALLDTVLDLALQSVVPEYAFFTEGERAVFKNAMVSSTMAMSQDTMTSKRMAAEIPEIIEGALLKYAKNPKFIEILTDRIEFFRIIRQKKENR